jgi:hypothetical protein
MSEFAMILLGCGIISPSSNFRGRKAPQVDGFSITGNARFPFPYFSYKKNPLKSIALFLSLIHVILRSGASPNIGPPIIQGIPVLMVAFLSYSAIEYFPVHAYAWHPASSSIKTLGIFRPNSMPIPFGKPLKVGGVHDGVLSLRKRNQSVGLVKRLSDRVSLHAAWVNSTWHLSSLKGLLQFSRILP